MTNMDRDADKGLRTRLGKTLAEQRKAKFGFSVHELSRRVGISHSVIVRAENGTTPASWETLRKWADVLHMRIEDGKLEAKPLRPRPRFSLELDLVMDESLRCAYLGVAWLVEAVEHRSYEEQTVGISLGASEEMADKRYKVRPGLGCFEYLVTFIDDKPDKVWVDMNYPYLNQGDKFRTAIEWRLPKAQRELVFCAVDRIYSCRLRVWFPANAENALYMLRVPSSFTATSQGGESQTDERSVVVPYSGYTQLTSNGLAKGRCHKVRWEKCNEVVSSGAAEQTSTERSV